MNHKREIAILIGLLLFSETVLAIGIIPPSIIVLEKGEHSLSFNVLNNERKKLEIKVYPEENLEKYVVIEKEIHDFEPHEEIKEIKYKLNLPEKIMLEKGEIIIEEMPKEKPGEITINTNLKAYHTIYFNKNPETIIGAQESKKPAVEKPAPSQKPVSKKIYLSVIVAVTFLIFVMAFITHIKRKHNKTEEIEDW